MKTSDLNLFFKDTLTGKSFEELISKEVEVYSKGMLKKGSSIPLEIYEDEDLYIDNEAVRKLLYTVHEKTLSTIHLSYICDCLTMTEKISFENPFLQDVIEEFADPEIKGGYKSIDTVIKAIVLLEPK